MLHVFKGFQQTTSASGSVVELHVVAVATQVRFLGGAYFYLNRVVSSVVRIPAFQAGGPGSIPGRRTIFVKKIAKGGFDPPTFGL